jgi:hypothetical protein
VKGHLLTAGLAALLVGAGIAVGVLVPEAPCSDGDTGTISYAYPGRESVLLATRCVDGRWVIDRSVRPEAIR